MSSRPARFGLLVFALGSFALPGCTDGSPSPTGRIRTPLVCESEEVELPELVATRVRIRSDGSVCAEHTVLVGQCDLWYPRFNETDPIWGACDGGFWRFTEVATGDCIRSDLACWNEGEIPDPRYSSCEDSTYANCCSYDIMPSCLTGPPP
jgi:hypothetical protein